MNDAPLQDTNMPDALSSGLDVPVSADTATTIPIEKLLSATPIAAPQPQVDRVADVLMSDSAAIYPTSSFTAPTVAPSPIPARMGTPVRNTNGSESASRAASQVPDTVAAIPSKAPLHGAPVRQYINEKVTGVLLEGMKQLAKEQPRDPLRVLGEYLIARSKDLEK